MLRPALILLLAFTLVTAGAQETKPAPKPAPVAPRPPTANPASAKPAEPKPVNGKPAEPTPASPSPAPAAGAGVPVVSPPAVPQGTPAVLPVPAAAPAPNPAAAAGPEVTAPPAPVDRIWDQTGKWTPGERQAAADELNAAAAQLRFGVYLVNLNAAPDEQAADLAKRLLYSWKGTADRAVILTGPGLQPPILIECDGESLGGIPQDQLAAFYGAARAEAAKAPAGLPASMAAARSLISRVNTFRSFGNAGPAVPVAAAGEGNDGHQGNLKILWLALGAISIVLLLAAAFFMKRRQTSALIFPPVAFRQRFSAPHSGGNNALVSFSGSVPPGKKNRP